MYPTLRSRCCLEKELIILFCFCILQSVLSGITVETVQRNVHIRVMEKTVRKNVTVYNQCATLSQAVQISIVSLSQTVHKAVLSLSQAVHTSVLSLLQSVQKLLVSLLAVLNI